MIYILTTKRHHYTLSGVLHSSPELTDHVRHLSYEKLFRMKSLPVATYIFADIERLDRDATEKAALVWNTLSNSNSGCRLLNHPIRSMRRYELLRTLYERGINNYNVRHLADAGEIKRFPVFIRAENEHKGNITPLLHTQEELQAAIDTIVSEGVSRDNKIIVEFCDVSDNQGIYHWHGAHRVGSTIFPVFKKFSKRWMAKKTADQLTQNEYADAHKQYVDSNPHEKILLDIFDIAGIQYGRIDYAMVDGKIQVFEINTNPVSLNARKLLRAAEEIDTSNPQGKHVAIRIPHTMDPPSKGEKGLNQYLLVVRLIGSLKLQKYKEPIISFTRNLKRIFGGANSTSKPGK